MDKARVKMLLASFRPGTDDENDPLFRQALEQLAHDAELAAWFRAEQEFDAAMIEKFREVPVNAAAGENIREALKRQIDTDAESGGA